jgi:Zn-dependent M28 family amino/carboxypeptidase
MFTIKNNFRESVESVRYFVENPNMQLHNQGRKKYNRIPNFYLPDSLISILLSQSYSELESLSNNSESFKTNIKINMRSFFIDTSLKSENILGFIEGTDLKEEIVVLSAHYDHIGYDNGEVCNGADDDGSGTVAVLEIAQAFALAKKEGKSPRRSILFLNVSGEEKGLLGSQFYTENPIYPLTNTIVDLNIDMIGRTDNNHDNDQYVYLIGSDRLSSDLDIIARQCNKVYAQLDLDYTYNAESDPNKFYYRSDHYNFARKNIPVIFYFSGVHEDYHKPTDDVEKILFSKTAQITRLIFHTAWELAHRDERPQLDNK